MVEPEEFCADRVWKFKVLTEDDLEYDRIQPMIDNLIGTETPDDLMLKIMETLLPLEDPRDLEVGNFCTFIYQPKTFLQYDEQFNCSHFSK